jgi:ATP-dependent exoDNAse (exonuclease V) beta subunit
VVVEPGVIASELDTAGRGLRLLYVALTRPTQHLSIVSSTSLPAELAS